MAEKGEALAQALADILVKQGAVSQAESASMHKLFVDSAKEAFDDFLLEEGLVTEEPLLKALSEYYQVPYNDVLGQFFNHQLLTLFPKGFLLREAVIPMALEEDILTVVASEPSDRLRARLDEFIDFAVEFHVGLRRDITDAVKEFYDESLTQVPEDGEPEDPDDIDNIVEEL